MKRIILIGALLIAACSKINTSYIVQMSHNCQWGIVPFANYTEIPQAGYRAMNITAGVLRSKGVMALKVYPVSRDCSQLITCPNSAVALDKVLQWARPRHLNYVVMGAVNEWDYKVGLDGEPIAAVSLQLYEVKSGRMLWSSVGSKIGTSRSGLALIGQKLINEMLLALKIQ